MSETREKAGRNKSALIAGSIIQSIRALRQKRMEATFNAILADLRSKGVLSNHTSLRDYLNLLTTSGLLNMHAGPTVRPNIRPKQLYSVTRNGPFVEAGERAMVFHGLNWILPAKSSVRLKTDLRGVVRARLRGILFASLEDTVVENLFRVKIKKDAGIVPSYCAALLASKNVDRSYLMLRATEKDVVGIVKELLDEIDYVFTTSNPKTEDVKTLYAIRRCSQTAHRRAPPRPQLPDWSVLSEDELIDVIGKQLGVK